MENSAVRGNNVLLVWFQKNIT